MIDKKIAAPLLDNLIDIASGTPEASDHPTSLYACFPHNTTARIFCCFIKPIRVYNKVKIVLFNPFKTLGFTFSFSSEIPCLLRIAA